MGNTNHYNWPYPEPTDLVMNGPADIEAGLQAADDTVWDRTRSIGGAYASTTAITANGWVLVNWTTASQYGGNFITTPGTLFTVPADVDGVYALTFWTDFNLTGTQTLAHAIRIYSQAFNDVYLTNHMEVTTTRLLGGSARIGTTHNFRLIEGDTIRLYAFSVNNATNCDHTFVLDRISA